MEAKIMGMVASQGRFLMLTAKKTDVEFQGQQINQARMVLANQSAAVNNTILSMPVLTKAEYTEDGVLDVEAYEAAKAVYDQAMNEYNLELAPIQLKDKNLELTLKCLDTEQQAIQTEMDAVGKVIDKNIETSFKTFG